LTNQPLQTSKAWSGKMNKPSKDYDEQRAKDHFARTLFGHTGMERLLR